LWQAVRIARRETAVGAESLERGTGEVRKRKLVTVNSTTWRRSNSSDRNVEDAIDCDFVMKHGLGKGNARCQAEIARAESSLGSSKRFAALLPK